MENQVVELLKKKYGAEAIILHGSRARGDHYKESDWDLLVFTKEKGRINGGEDWNGQDLDIIFFELPIIDVSKFINDYPHCRQYVRVLLDTDDKIAMQIQKEGERVYQKGKEVSDKFKSGVENHLGRMLKRLNASTDQPEVFFYHLSSFYQKTIRYWFEYNGDWSQTVRRALKTIEKEDPAFMKEIKIIADNTKTKKEKIEAAEVMAEQVINRKQSSANNLT